MGNKGKIIGLLLLPVAGILINAARAEYLKPRDAGAQQPATIRLRADLSDKILYVQQNGKVVKTYTFADGSAKYPTPKGTFRVGKVIWHPAWVPPESKWARKKTAKDPGEPGNPMKLVKIFFKEPDYYIHGTDQLESIGSSASHGCIRMDPVEAAELAIRLMEGSGARKDADWYQNAIEKGQTRSVVLPRRVEMVITG
ncbi:MAG: L,D-transpeptidase [Gemmatimonadota bacterium]|nr:L,D-transpeptidase [Gemmatimonadota bacterium]